ncbi:unannotated protein [freshwater metagenome]|uniref:Unannotated protein n=1 Tax=freshwater metagenome TaxID=449393 RepID=A0A6J6A1H7_9ZZZZ
MQTTWKNPISSLRKLEKQRLEEARADEELRQRQIQEIIDEGPPPGSGISPANWADWHRHRFVCCPKTRFRYICDRVDCGAGGTCQEMTAVGLRGDGASLPRKLRPICSARNREGDRCGVRVEPGKRVCRFHGGLSTGPRTAEGRARIAEAMRKRHALHPTKTQRTPKTATDRGGIGESLGGANRSPTNE